jgi:hypothetical protein
LYLNFQITGTGNSPHVIIHFTRNLTVSKVNSGSFESRCLMIKKSDILSTLSDRRWKDFTNIQIFNTHIIYVITAKECR